MRRRKKCVFISPDGKEEEKGKKREKRKGKKKRKKGRQQKPVVVLWKCGHRVKGRGEKSLLCSSLARNFQSEMFSPIVDAQEEEDSSTLTGSPSVIRYIT